MKEYICLRCKIKFNNKSHIRQHFKRKKLCQVIFKDYSYDYLLEKLNSNKYIEFYNDISHLNNIQCKFCFKLFSNKYNLNRHMSSCKCNKNALTLSEKNGVQTNITNNNITVNQQQNIIINNFGKEDLSLVEFNKMLFIKNEKQFWENKKYISNMHHNINLMLKGIYNKPENINFTNDEENEKHYYLLEDKDTLYDKDNFFEIILNNSFQHFKNYLYKNKLEYTFEHYITYLNSHFLKYNISNWQSNNKIKSIFYNFISEKT